jgi:hypothetical protein
MALIRRSRGALLRLVRRRKLSAVVGLMLVVPAAWVEFSGGDFAWWIQGLALTGGATGVAVLWTAVVGLTPDWIEEDRSENGEGRR